jgi:sugar-specific transcriptional regulator TrmB
MNIEKILNKYGFPENEVKIYLALLKHSDISAFHLANETKLPRTSVYHILDTLINQGLVTSWKKNNVHYYTAESPNRLIKVLDDKKELIKSILPEMLGMKDADELNPKTRLYTGAEGMKIVWEDILETLESTGSKEIHAVTYTGMFHLLPKYFPQWLKRREKLGIKTYAIAADIEENKVPGMRTDNFRETRLLPPGPSLKGTIDIYANKIAFFSVKEKEIYSIIIESNSMSEMLRQFFLSTWELLGEKSRY